MPDHDGWTHIEKIIPLGLPPGYSIVWSDMSGQDGYYGHDPSCDCAVCDDIAFSRSLRGTPYTEPAAIELLRQKKEKFESALKKIARGTLEPGHVYQQAVMMQDIAREALADRP